MNETATNPEIRDAIIAITRRLLDSHGTIDIINVGPWAEVFPPGAQHDMMVEPIGSYDGVRYAAVIEAIADKLPDPYRETAEAARTKGFLRLTTIRPTPPTEQDTQ